MVSTLGKISAWANGAENEDFDKEYFFEPSWLKRIKSGERILIIGRKGTGKTAIARQLAQSDESAFAESVPFDAIDAARFGFAREDAFDREILTRVCRYLMLRTVCELLLEEDKDGGLTSTIEKSLGVSLLEYRKRPLSERLRKLRIDAMGFGVEVGIQGSAPAATTPGDLLEQRIAQLTTALHGKAYARPFRIVFDALDSGWIEACQDNNQARYTRKIGALIAAAIETRNQFKGSGLRIIPLVFTRADIFSQIVNAQRTAWEQDYGLHLDWTRGELQELLLHRIHQSARFYEGRCDLKRAIEMTFKRRSGDLVDFDGNTRRLQLTDYVIDFSIGRPRDVVVYLAKTATLVLRENRKDGRITKEDITSGITAYGQFLREEIQDELGGEYPGIRRLLNGMRGATALALSYDRFGEIARKTLKSSMSGGELQLLAERLFELGVIGHQLADGSHQFAVRDPTVTFDELLPLKLHPSYSTALSVSA